MLPLPPTVTAVTQAIITALTVNNAAYCRTEVGRGAEATDRGARLPCVRGVHCVRAHQLRRRRRRPCLHAQLLRHPLTRKRITAMAGIADCGAILAQSLLPPSTTLAFSGGWGPEDGAQSWCCLVPCSRPVSARRSRSPPTLRRLLCICAGGHYEHTCRSVLSYVQVCLGLLLPTMVSARWWCPNRARQAAAAGSTSAASAAAGSRSATAAAAALPRHVRLWRWAAAARIWADDAMHSAVQGGPALAVIAAYWWLLAFVWMCCTAVITCEGPCHTAAAPASAAA